MRITSWTLASFLVAALVTSSFADYPRRRRVRRRAPPMPTAPPGTGPLCQLSANCINGLHASKDCLQTYYSGHKECLQGLKVWQTMLTKQNGCPDFNSDAGKAQAFCWCGLESSRFNESLQSDAVTEKLAVGLEARLEETRPLLNRRLDGAMARKGPCDKKGACCNKNDGNALQHVGPYWTGVDMTRCGQSADGSVDQAASCVQPHLGVSTGCAHCFGLAIHCARTHCVTECACSHWVGQGPCKPCMQNAGCAGQFNSCSGSDLPGSLSQEGFLVNTEHEGDLEEDSGSSEGLQANAEQEDISGGSIQEHAEGFVSWIRSLLVV